MRLLLVTPYYPFPAEKTGGTHTIHMIIKHIDACEFDIFYYGESKCEEVSFSDNIRTVLYEDLRTSGVCRRVQSIIRGKTYSSFMFKERSEILMQLLQNEQYDYVLLDQFSSMQYSKDIQENMILFMHDSMPMLFKRKAYLSPVIGKVYYYFQNRYAIREEKQYYKEFKKIFFVSSKDVEYEKMIHSQHTHKFAICNLGIDLEMVDLAPNINLKENSLIFTGIMDYEPNEDAMIYFLEDIFDSVLENISSVHLYIVGKNPTKKLIEIASNKKNVTITGEVKNIFSYIKAGAVYISPLRMGSGKKNKIIEAMACGKPIVASPVSMEGFDELIVDRLIPIARTKSEWVNSIVDLLNNPQKRQWIGQRMRSNIDDTYSWKSIARDLIDQETCQY